MSKQGVPEYWVCRVMLHQGRRVQLHLLPDGIGRAVQADIDAGAYCLLSDGSICEPVESFPEEPDAHERRGVLAVAHPSEDFRVVMTVVIAEERARG